jgi:hypothetical protein
VASSSAFLALRVPQEVASEISETIFRDMGIGQATSLEIVCALTL